MVGRGQVSDQCLPEWLGIDHGYKSIMDLVVAIGMIMVPRAHEASFNAQERCRLMLSGGLNL